VIRSSRRSFGTAAALLALAPLAGCSLLAPSAPAPTKQVLDELPRELPSTGRRDAMLVVLAVHAAPVYDTTAIAYRSRPGEIDFFARHEWADPPARMLQPLAVRVLQATGAFEAVVGAPYFGHAPQVLRLELDELLADFSVQPAVLRLSLRAVLQVSGRLRARAVSAAQPIVERNPQGVVRAANAATAQALLEIARFVLEGEPREASELPAARR
jgi:cholesterol transport system auxiliary component